MNGGFRQTQAMEEEEEEEERRREMEELVGEDEKFQVMRNN